MTRDTSVGIQARPSPDLLICFFWGVGWGLAVLVFFFKCIFLRDHFVTHSTRSVFLSAAEAKHTRLEKNTIETYGCGYTGTPPSLSLSNKAYGRVVTLKRYYRRF